LRLLSGALKLSPRDPVALNEAGVVYLRMGRPAEAVAHLARAVAALDAQQAAPADGSGSGGGSGSGSGGGGSAGARAASEVLGNYAAALRKVPTHPSLGHLLYPGPHADLHPASPAHPLLLPAHRALRKAGRLDDALAAYRRCLEMSPLDAATHAGIGFTLHLQRRVGAAIAAYHRALALQPTFTFCAEMLGRAMLDAAAGLGVDHPTAPPSSSRSSSSSSSSSSGGFGMASAGYIDPNVDTWLDEYAFDGDDGSGNHDDGMPSAVDFVMGATDDVLPYGMYGGGGSGGDAMDVAGEWADPPVLPPPPPPPAHTSSSSSSLRPTPRRQPAASAAATPPFMPPPPPGAAAFSAASAASSMVGSSASGSSSAISQSRVAGRLSMDSGGSSSDASGLLGSPPGALHWS